jgi:hypothetical protein
MHVFCPYHTASLGVGATRDSVAKCGMWNIKHVYNTNKFLIQE